MEICKPQVFYNLAMHLVFFKIQFVVSHALLRKFHKIQIVAREGLKLFACLLPPLGYKSIQYYESHYTYFPISS